MRIFTVDAFANAPFTGNPAAVCLLDSPAADDWMQRVAAEMNLSETAFVTAGPDHYDLRWFTPTVEVDLCGHATLASAHILWTEAGAPLDRPVRFATRSGTLTANRAGDSITLDFPATPARQAPAPPGLLDALGVSAKWVGRSRFDYLVVVDDAKLVLDAAPDLRALGEVDARGVIVTAPTAAGTDPEGRGDPEGSADFVSRFFAPTSGVDEDPVTGSAHCCLGPYWAGVLNTDRVRGYQASKRGGYVDVTVRGERVELAGKAITTVRGELISA